MKIVVRLTDEDYYMIYRRFDNDFEIPVDLRKFYSKDDCLNVAEELAEIQLLNLEVVE